MDVDSLRPKKSPEGKLQRAARHRGKARPPRHPLWFAVERGVVSDFQQTEVLIWGYRRVTNTWLSVSSHIQQRRDFCLLIYGWGQSQTLVSYQATAYRQTGSCTELKASRHRPDLCIKGHIFAAPCFASVVVL